MTPDCLADGSCNRTSYLRSDFQSGKAARTLRTQSPTSPSSSYPKLVHIHSPRCFRRDAQTKAELSLESPSEHHLPQLPWRAVFLVYLRATAMSTRVEHGEQAEQHIRAAEETSC